MSVAINLRDDIDILKLSGEIVARHSQELCELLRERVASGRRKLIVDLSRVKAPSRIDVRRLIAAARDSRMVGAETRICGARGATDILLRSLGANGLLPSDRTLAGSMAAFSPAHLGAANGRPHRLADVGARVAFSMRRAKPLAAAPGLGHDDMPVAALFSTHAKGRAPRAPLQRH
ncbi:STAS domain-containing protein [Acuticoccus sp. M5D2P5]|uniref:STAS domain-containing protein n=1 Tax=Acuticoccus kalidii TaxID=2910977 RepID=UPI001F3E9ACA|nr:STAS domain-containing protein [Acuticoccus kalidii]MCF3934758.1 STAS domain-containing protein [Acuticoccus kalidii]